MHRRFILKPWGHTDSAKTRWQTSRKLSPCLIPMVVVSDASGMRLVRGGGESWGPVDANGSDVSSCSGHAIRQPRLARVCYSSRVGGLQAKIGIQKVSFAMNVPQRIHRRQSELADPHFSSPPYPMPCAAVRSFYFFSSLYSARHFLFQAQSPSPN